MIECTNVELIKFLECSLEQKKMIENLQETSEIEMLRKECEVLRSKIEYQHTLISKINKLELDIIKLNTENLS